MFGMGEHAECEFVQQTTDGGYVMTGGIFSELGNTYDVLVIKTDSNGIEEWNQAYGEAPRDKGEAILQTTDGGYVVVANTESYGFGYNDIWLIRL